jgi:hypothetical protein
MAHVAAGALLDYLREQVEAGDVVVWRLGPRALGCGSCGSVPSGDGGLTVGGGIDWWANPLWADCGEAQAVQRT